MTPLRCTYFWLLSVGFLKDNMLVFEFRIEAWIIAMFRVRPEHRMYYAFSHAT